MGFSILLGDSIFIAIHLFLSTYNLMCPGRREAMGDSTMKCRRQHEDWVRDGDLEMRFCCLWKGRKGSEWRNVALRVGEARKQWFPEPLQGAQPADTYPWTQWNWCLTSDSRTTKERICVVLGHQVCGDLLGCSRKQIKILEHSWLCGVKANAFLISRHRSSEVPSDPKCRESPLLYFLLCDLNG